jgi:hypothetical protein
MKLFCIALTKNDSSILRAWLDAHYFMFERIALVDGSTNEETANICSNYPTVIYCKDPPGLITDQTLRHHGFEQLRPFIQKGDWIFLGHPDEFLIHDPRHFMVNESIRYMWMPLLALPHPSEKNEILSQRGEYDPRSVMKYRWYRVGQLPHCENRMFRYDAELVWDLESPKKSSSTIPVNIHSVPLSRELPIYVHFKITNFQLDTYSDSGKLIDSGLDTGVDRTITNLDSLFFDETNVWGEGYNEFIHASDCPLSKFGDPPRIISEQNKVLVVNSTGKIIH